MKPPFTSLSFKSRTSIKRLRVVLAAFVVCATLTASLLIWRVQAHKSEAQSASQTASGQSPASQSRQSQRTRLSAFERFLSPNPLAPLASFTPGNIVVCRPGDGVTPLSSAATVVFVDEYTPAGSLVQSVALPTTDSGANQILTVAGTSTNECALNRSADGRYLLITGYDAVAGTPAVAGTSTTGGTPIVRVIGRIDKFGAIDTTTTTTSFTAGNIRSATSDNGANVWAVGSNSGVVFTTLAASGAGTVVSTTVTNNRVTGIFGAQLYTSDSSGVTVRLGTVGTGLPTTAGQTITNLPGYITTGASNGFFFADLDAGVAGVDTLYQADDGAGAGATGGGVKKFSLVGGNWTYNGTFPASGAPAIPATTFFGLTGTVSGGVVTLYATRAGAQVVKFVDATGYNVAPTAIPTLLATNAANTAFRGIALAPQVITLSPASLVNGTFNATYNFPITASGGVAPYTFAVTSGTVPTGLTLNSDGTWSGTATATGTFNFTVTATDAGGQTGSQAYSLTINPVLNVTTDPAVTEGNAGTTLATFTVTLTPSSSQTVTVHYLTQDNSATTADNDYVAIPDTLLTFLPGETSKNIDVTVNGDTNVEPTEQFFFNITTPSNANISDNQGVGTITNDDVAVNYSITTTGNAIVITDNSGNSDPLGMTEPGVGLVSFNATGRSFSVDGAAPITGNSGSISLTGINSITANENAGNDGFFVGTFVGQLPSLTINGGTGNDSVQFSGAITFAANANLDIDMQNDDPTPGLDRVDFISGGQLHLSGTGAATIKVSQAMTIAGPPGTTFLEVQNGNLTIEINQQLPTTTGTSPGLFLNSGTLRTTGTGNINVLGKAQSQPGTGGHRALLIVGGATITSTSAAVGAGTITLNGTGGQGTADNAGVEIDDPTTLITSVVGNISITGQGGAATTTRNYGVNIANGASITSTGSAKITIDGTGSGTGTTQNSGARMIGNDSKITSSGGDILITGHGGAGTGGNHLGVSIALGALVNATNGAKITINGTAGTGTSSLGGVNIALVGSQPIPVPTTISSDSGDIQITGQAGSGTALGNIGITIAQGAHVTATGNAKVTMNGTGGTGTTDCYGIDVEAADMAGTLISSVNGDISMTGTATNATGTDQDGVRLEDSVGAQAIAITTTGTGTLTITGMASNNDPTSSGIQIADDTNITLTGPQNFFIGDTIDFGVSNVSINAGANTIMLRQKTNGVAIALGGADSASQLGLTDAELDLITAGTLNIGNASSGAMTVSAPVTRAAATVLKLTSGANIDVATGSLNSAGGNVTLNPGTNVFPATAAWTSRPGPLLPRQHWPEPEDRYQGNTPDTGYTQLSVTGLVNISGVNLSLSGAHLPVIGQTFTIVNNDGADAITGNFNGLFEGATIPNFLGSGLSAKLSYSGGDGNDVVLTVMAAPTAAPARIGGQILDPGGQPVSGATVTVSGGPTLIRAITDTNGFYRVDGLAVGDFYTVTPSRANFALRRRTGQSRWWLTRPMPYSLDRPLVLTQIRSRVRSSLCGSSIWTFSVASPIKAVWITGVVNCEPASQISTAPGRRGSESAPRSLCQRNSS